MAVKQSLMVICFTGLHILGADPDVGYARIGMSEDLFFDWILWRTPRILAEWKLWEVGQFL